LLLTGCPEDEEEETTTTTGEDEDGAGVDGAGEAGAEATFVLVALAVSEAEALQALLARMIPSDDLGPGAVEAGVMRYIDRALGSEAGEQLDFLRANLAAVDEFARQMQDQRFGELEPDVQDELVGAIERGEAEGFTPGAGEFFAALRELALQGMFGDPFYGGNINNAGWDLISFPGIRLEISEDEQELDAEPPEGEASTYDFENFGFQRQREG
jgi:gluconate 2-dehydrogenase gamma chain